MKSIECFIYKNTYNFEKCLKDYGYAIEDVEGFSVSNIKRYHGNVFKTYIVYVFDGESIYFSVAYFKDFNELNQSRLGFKGDKLLSWYNSAAVRQYKVKDVWGMKDEYVIEA